MTEKRKTTPEQKARIYCVKNGHANFYYLFWGYCYCGRCGEQIGDKLGGVFFGAERMASPQCNKKPCKICDAIYKKLNKIDKLIFDRMKKFPDKTHTEILKGIVWQK